MIELAVVVATLAVVGVAGAVWRARQGRVRAGSGRLPEDVRALLETTDEVTLLMLTAPGCARCPQARVVLRRTAADTAGVRYQELNLADHPQIAGELGVRSTPTTLVVSPDGDELSRIIGVPAPGALSAVLPAQR